MLRKRLVDGSSIRPGHELGDRRDRHLHETIVQGLRRARASRAGYGGQTQLDRPATDTPTEP